MANILVTGAKGQLGSELRKLSQLNNYGEFTFTDVDELDITNSSAVQDFCTKHTFNFIINCAAYTAVDKAETDIELATKINQDAVKNLVKAASLTDAVLIHVSTDYVFDGNAC